MLWKRQVTLEQLNQQSQACMVGHVGIRYTCLAEDSLEAVMPVDSRTRQPFGLLHGGASVVLAESLGSVAGYLCSEGDQQVVGLEINANHLRAVREGKCGAYAARFTLVAGARCGRLRSLIINIACAVFRV